MRKYNERKKAREANQKEQSSHDTEGRTIQESKKEIEERGLPIELVNKYGRTAVEVVLNEKNRGIGYTADEIFELRDKRIKILTLGEITEIYEGLENAGL